VPKADIIHPSELTATEIVAWRRLQSDAPGLGSPLLGPGFAQAVGAVREDARVAVWREGRRSVGFLGFHRAGGGLARPIGAPFSDYQALISRPGFPPATEALEAAGLSRMRLSGLLDPHGVFPGDFAEVAAHRIDLSLGAQAYLDSLWAGGRNRWRNYKRYSRRLAREIGPLELRAPDHSQAAFDALLGWKRRQLAGTGLHDFTAASWVRELMQRLFETREEGFSGLMISLYAGDRPVAAHFGVRQDGWYHPWLGAYDPELAPFSPGMVHQVLAAAGAAGIGIHTYDLGPRADRSKAMFANRAVTVGEGVVAGTRYSASLAAGAGRLLSLAPGPFGLVERVRRRWEHVAAVELTFGRRMSGMARAAAALNRRIDAWSRAA
jgi:CelD/BcsL family acetyltransferase involved in cellulose biosynthesis